MFGSGRQYWILSESSTSSTDYYWYQVSPLNTSTQPSWSGLLGYPSMATNPVSSSTTGMVLVGAITDSNVAPSSTLSGAIGIYKKNGVSTNYITTTANTASGTTFGSGTITPSGLVYTVGQNGGATTGVLYSFGLNGTLRSENTISSQFSGARVVATPTSNVIVSSANVVTCIATTTTPTINWTTAINQSNWPTQTVECVGADSTGNVYVAYYAQHTGGGQVHPYLVQLNNSGTINWQQDLGSQISSIADLSEIAVDSTGNVYSYGNGVIAKWNNGGTLLWQELLQVTSGAAQGQVAGGILAIDAVDNIYISNPMTFTTGGNVVNVGGQITKLDSNGNLIFSNMLTLGNVANVNINNTFIESAGTTGNVTNVMYLNISTQEDYASDKYYLWNFALPADGSFTGNTWTNSFGGEALQYSALSNVTATATSNISTTTGNLTSSTASTTIGATLGYSFAQQVIPGNLVSLGTSVYPPVTYNASYLIVAGGGGGGGSNSGAGYPCAGGGAGGLLSGSAFTLSPGTTYSFTVGAGGAGGANGSTGSNGSNSTAFTLTAIGGGGGGCNSNGSSGGSGGGAYGYPLGTYAGGTGTAGQGYAGGAGYTDSVSYTNSGGGGGAGAVGGAATSSQGGNGGIGVQSSITGTATYYAGGGGGATGEGSGGTTSTGGLGGGGNGGNLTGGPTTPGNGTANTGGGGGGGVQLTGGNGGSGVVIISVPTAHYTGTVSGAPTVTTSGSNTIMTFTASGSYTA